MNNSQTAVEAAAEVVRDAVGLLIGAGAGMGVDSGLPDFRGNEGFWKAYPPFRGKRFAEVSNPVWFRWDPEQAWGFFGHRMELYRTTTPHRGFEILRRWGERMPAGSFVFTSNVDGHFQKAGFDESRIVECHGALTHLQCVSPCSGAIWDASETSVSVDPDSIRATGELPRCIHCGELARPNVLMFGDFQWVEGRYARQAARYADWIKSMRGRSMAIVELGAGTAVPTVRLECESRFGRLVRINPRDFEVPADGISLPLRALAALEAVDQCL